MLQSAQNLPYGATSWAGVLAPWFIGTPLWLYDGTKTMLRIQLPFLPEWTQWPAVHTRLDLPGCAGSSTIVPEQAIGPSGPSTTSLPIGAMWRSYGRVI